MKIIVAEARTLELLKAEVSRSVKDWGTGTDKEMRPGAGRLQSY